MQRPTCPSVQSPGFAQLSLRELKRNSLGYRTLCGREQGPEPESHLVPVPALLIRFCPLWASGPSRQWSFQSLFRGSLLPGAIQSQVAEEHQQKVTKWEGRVRESERARDSTESGGPGDLRQLPEEVGWTQRAL